MPAPRNASDFAISIKSAQEPDQKWHLHLTLAALLGGTPYAVALTLTACVYALGPLSGCHLNPAVTVALVAARRLPARRGALYVLAQGGGALLARLVAGQAGAGRLAAQYHVAPAALEFVGCGILILTVLAVARRAVPEGTAGVAIGAALAAGLLTSRGVLNPAVALAMGLALTPATWATLLSGVAGAGLVRAMQPPVAGERTPTEPSRSPAARRGHDRARADGAAPPGPATRRAGGA